MAVLRTGEIIKIEKNSADGKKYECPVCHAEQTLWPVWNRPGMRRCEKCEAVMYNSEIDRAWGLK